MSLFSKIIIKLCLLSLSILLALAFFLVRTTTTASSGILEEWISHANPLILGNPPEAIMFVFLFEFGDFSSLLFIQIHDVKYSNDGQRFLIISGTMQAKLYDRDGEELYVLFSLL
jgi:hypothetical protein